MELVNKVTKLRVDRHCKMLVSVERFFFIMLLGHQNHKVLTFKGTY